MSLAHAFDHQLGLPSIPDATPVVFVIDEDIFVRTSLQMSIQREGWLAETFASGPEFLARPRPLVPSCLILDLSRTDRNGLELQKQLARERADMPIIAISGFKDIPTTVQAMKAGAADFLVKPFKNDVLVEAVRECLERSRVALERETEIRNIASCYSFLTPRERQVMALVVSGLLNKQVGGELGISEVTVKAHRGQVMQKMKANSLADLVKMAAKLRPSRHALHLV